MTKLEEYDVEMIGGMSAFFEKKKEKMLGYNRLVAEISKLNGYQLLLAPMIAKQAEVTTGVTADKLGAMTDLGNRLIKLSVKAVAYANDNNNQTLAAIFNITSSNYKNQSQAKKLIQAQGFLDGLEAHALALEAHKISSDDISAIRNGISICQRHVFEPTTDSSTKEAATMSIKDLIRASKVSLALIDGFIKSEYKDSDPDFVNEYFIKRKVDGRGVRHTGINVTFTDAATGKVMEGATVGIALLNKTAVSNISGLAAIPKMKTGTYHVDFSASGYTAQLQDVIVPRSRKVDIAVVMVAI